MIGEQPVVVSSVTRESDRVVSLHLRREDSEPMPSWQPGAHIDLRLPAFVRSYSLCGDPQDRSAWRIAVLREENSRGASEFIHTSVRAGDRVVAGAPRNDFVLGVHDRYILVAGGIGITPLLPMVHQLAALGADWSLTYGARHSASMAFVDELAGYGARVALWPEDTRGLIDLDQVLGDPQPGTGVYCCGPVGLLDAVERRSAGWPVGTLHTERFIPRAAAAFGPPTVGGQPFEVELARTGAVITVSADMSILETLEEHGFDPDYSCRQGQCGTCETTVLSGTPDHRDDLLDEASRQAGDTMMICVSRSQTPRLVLDL